MQAPSIKLARWVEGDVATLTVLRDLTPGELSLHERYQPLTGAAMERLALFKLLAHNYEEWKTYLESLLSAQPLGDEGAKLNLNRLLLNYLTCAYTIREHFQVVLKQRFRGDPSKISDYEAFIQRLVAGSWATAFFFDFRDYVQHRGLGIGNYHRNVTRTSVVLTISCDAAALAQESRHLERDWHHSKLKGTEGTLELVPLLAQFHEQMLKSYARYVTKLIYPELEEAAEFYSLLTREAVAENAGFKMVLSNGNAVIEKIGDRTDYKYSLLCAPNDLFAEVGLALPKLL
jgi:hypothetical protein